MEKTEKMTETSQLKTKRDFNKTSVSAVASNDGLCVDNAGYVEQLEMIIANSDPDGLPEDMGILKAKEIWERLHKKYYPANYA